MGFSGKIIFIPMGQEEEKSVRVVVGPYHLYPIGSGRGEECEEMVSLITRSHIVMKEAHEKCAFINTEEHKINLQLTSQSIVRLHIKK